MRVRFQKYYFIIFSVFSGIATSFAQDITPPEKPVISYVTVDTSNNNVNIFWEKSTSPDVSKYFLYYEVKTPQGFEGVKFDSVASTVNSYTHVTAGLAGSQTLIYSVTAMDVAGNESLRKPGLHGTIHCTVSYDSCNSTLSLQWNKYLGWGNNVSGYRVLKREGSGTFQTIAGINKNDSSYVVYGVPENTQFSFFIEGVKNDNLVSTSNLVSKSTYMPLPPDELLLGYVTVTDPQSVEIKFSFTDPSPITNFALLRSNQEFSEFEQVRTFQNISASPAIISDSIITTADRYFYRIGALNTCGVSISSSNLGTNILLEGDNFENSNFLKWSSYKDFPGGFGFYEVYRSDTTGSLQLIGTTNGLTTFADDLSSIAGQNFSGKLIYQVRAVENGGLNYSFSNLCDIKIKSEIWMPNAFTPNGDGNNDVFAPRLSFVPDDFLMLIYDRSGIGVFRSENAGIGWDGRINGNNFAPEGVYTYHVQFSSLNGQKGSKTGHVTVFYPR